MSKSPGYLSRFLQVLGIIFILSGSAHAIDVKYFSQNDPAWANDHMNNSSTLIGGVTGKGCTMTCVAMLLRYYGFDTDPGKLNTWLSSEVGKGYDNNENLNWYKPPVYCGGKMNFIKKIPYVGNPINSQAINDELAAGYPVIVQVKSETHWVVLTERIGTDYKIRDPYWNYSTLSSFGNYITDAAVYHGTPSSPTPIDTTLPTGDNQTFYQDGLTFSGAFNIGGWVTDPGTNPSGVREIHLVLDGGADLPNVNFPVHRDDGYLGFSVPFNTRDIGNGPHSLRLRVIDNNNNEYDLDRSFNVYNDKTDPVIVLGGAIPGAYNTPPTVTWSVTDESNFDIIQEWWDDQDNRPSLGATGTITVPDTEGSHVFHVYARDIYNNWSPKDSGVYIIDHTKPAINLTSFPPDACNADGQTCWQVTDSSGVANVSYKWDDAADYTSATAELCVQVPDGTHTLHVRATDNAGNIQEQAFGPFAVDRIPPVAPANLAVIADSYSASLTWTAPVETGCAAITGYNVYRRRAREGGYSKINDTLLTTTSYTDSGLTNGTAFDFAVAAVDQLGRTGAMAEKLAQIIGKPGDVNSDDRLDVRDLLMCINIIKTPGNYSAAQRAAADVDHNNTVDASDVTAIKNKILSK